MTDEQIQTDADAQDDPIGPGAEDRIALDIQVQYDLCVNYAMQQNDVPVVKQLCVHNPGTLPLEDLELAVWIDHEISHKAVEIIGRIGPGESWTLETLDLVLDPRILLRQEEREAAFLHVEVKSALEVLGHSDLPIDILAHNEWGGLSSLPEILAAFVMPNQRAVENILQKVRAHLQQRTGEGSISGYQRQSRTRVREMTEACYLALRDTGIGYINPPASFESQGQKVRSPSQIEKSRLATCLDLALLAAGCLEQCGLHPLVFMLKGHAFAGVWTSNNTFPEPAVDDAARMRKRIHLGDILAFETTGVTTQPAMTFAAAEAEALRHLDDSDEFVCVIDIRAARKLRIRPLPSRGQATPSGDEMGSLAAVPSRDEDDDADILRDVSTPDLVDSEPAIPEEPEEKQEQEPTTPAGRLESWKHKLLDLSLRNRLLNFRESKKTVPLMVADIAELEDALADGYKFVVHARPKLADPDSPRDLGIHQDRTQADALQGFLRDDLRDRRLRADTTDEDLDNRLLGIYRQARNDLDETGANTLFLALGFLAWYESDSSQKQRLSPIILLPLHITRQSIQDGFRIRAADDDPRINVTLLKKLEKDFKIDVSHLGELPEDESGLDVEGILQRFRQAIVNMARWDVVEKAQIGLFSFSKFLMWQDLEEHAEDLLLAPVVKHLVERPGDPFGPDDGWPKPRELDKTRDAADTLCPMDADSSQLAAIFAAEEGKTFVLQGPPGTGKSQTITNLIAHTLGLGKRVLFVAEKMAALNVVYDRLSKIGLSSACLEIHSNKASKRQVLDQIQATLDLRAPREPSDWSATAKELERRKSELNAYVEAIHEQRACGYSVFRATSQLIGLAETPLVELDLGDVEEISQTELEEQHELLERLETAVAAVAPVDENALSALEIQEWRTSLAADLKRSCAHLQEAATTLDNSYQAISAELCLGDTGEACPASETVLFELSDLCSLLLETPGPDAALLTEPGWSELVEELERSIALGRERDAERLRLLERYSSTFLDEDAVSHLAHLHRVQASMIPFRWFRMWGLRSKLKMHARQRLPKGKDLEDDLEGLRRLQAQSMELRQPTARGLHLFGRYWRDGEADWDALTMQIAWAGRFREVLASIETQGAFAHNEFRSRCLSLATDERDRLLEPGASKDAFGAFVDACDGLARARTATSEDIRLNGRRAFGSESEQGYLAHIQSWSQAAASRSHTLRDWCHWQRTRGEACEAGLAPLVQKLESGDLRPSALRASFDRAFLESFVNTIIDGTELLRRFNSHEHTRRIESFRKLDKRLMTLSKQVVQARLAAKVPGIQESASSRSEVGILARQLKLKRRHMPIRRLFEELPNLMPRLKPCLLMSPLSVAQYLAPGYPAADLVIFDEASQIPVWDAIGALARGESAIIVGDSKQLPPTSFFQRMDDDEESDEDSIQDLESILDESEVCGLTTLHLDWHYRSRHESLIAFSNHYYYDNKLLTFPSAAHEVEGLGVSLRYFSDGVYDKGRSRTNRVEAEAIRDDVLHRLKSHVGPGDPRSIGVVAFSQAQQNLIEDLLDEARRQHPEIERYFGSKVQEPVFIKNLENVQGDERDTILFSICYGPDLARKISMSFGPVNRQGGERRLNVAITRARCEVVVFSSIRSDDIDLRRTQALGVRHLRTFLDYAVRGSQALATAVSLEPDAEFDSPFEKEVHDALLAKGHDIDIQIGCSGYRIDLAVRHPEHPGRYVLGIECDGASYHSGATARDRDRLRESVLAGLGWRLHRIWSTDWWTDPRGQLDRLEEAIADALSSRPVAGDDLTSTPEVDVADLADEDSLPRTTPATEDLLPDSGEAEEGSEPGLIAGVSSSTSNTLDPSKTIDPVAERPEPERPTPKRAETEEPDKRGLRCTRYPDPPKLTFRADSDDFYLSTSTSKIARQITAIVETEAPLHFDRLCRQIITWWDMGRIGSRIRKRIETALDTIPGHKRPVLRQDFLWLPDQDSQSWKMIRIPDPSDSEAHSDSRPEQRRAEEIPPIEIANGAEYILQQQIALPFEDLERETAALFGISRLGKNVKACMSRGIGLLEMRGGCTVEEGQVIGHSQ